MEKPYLAIYPLPDISFLGSDEFKKIRVKSDNLPGSGVCYDVMEADVRYYKQIQVYGPEGSTLGTQAHSVVSRSSAKRFYLGQGKCMILAGTEPSDSVTPEDFDSWYREEVNIVLRPRRLDGISDLCLASRVAFKGSRIHPYDTV